MKYFPKLTTAKLYYRKWSYKIKCRCQGSWMIKRCGINYALRQCSVLHHDKSFAGYGRNFNPERLRKFIADVEQFLDKDIFIRTEGSIFNIYCNDPLLFDKICKKMDHWIEAVYEPANNTEHQFIMENGRRKVLCNHLPFHRYQYKAYLKEQIKDETKEHLWSWMSKYDGKMRTPVGVANWLMCEKRWITNPCIYVEDGATLSMFLLFLGDRVSKVEEFVPRSVINTQSKEITCPV